MVQPAAQYRPAASVLDSGVPPLSAAAVGAAAAAAAAIGNTGHADGSGDYVSLWRASMDRDAGSFAGSPFSGLTVSPGCRGAWGQPNVEQSTISTKPPGLAPPAPCPWPP